MPILQRELKFNKPLHIESKYYLCNLTLDFELIPSTLSSNLNF